MTDTSLNATLAYRKDITDDLSIVRVVPDNPALLRFEPGQYAELAIPPADSALGNGHKPAARLIRRAYSIASAPTDALELEFYIARIEEGQLTPHLWDLQVGDRLWIGPLIKGKFVLNSTAAGNDLVMIATGTGIAPFVSMLREFCSKPRWQKCVVIHGVRCVADLAYRQELEQYADASKGFFYIPTVTREPANSNWPGLRGRVQDIVQGDDFLRIVGEPLTPATWHVFLCGHPQMIDSTQALLENKGFHLHKTKTPGNIHCERYW